MILENSFKTAHNFKPLGKYSLKEICNVMSSVNP